MNGKIPALAIVVFAAVAGAVLYYLQVYGYYEDAKLTESETVIRLTSLVTNQPEEILVENVQAIDAVSSPLRFRSCFTTPMSLSMLTETYVPYAKAVPLKTPGWFDCFDPEEIGGALESGGAVAFLAEKEINDGVDRVVAVFPDGRAFAWHQLNDKYAE